LVNELDVAGESRHVAERSFEPVVGRDQSCVESNRQRNIPSDARPRAAAELAPSYSMKGTDRDRMLGAVIGKALEPLANGAGVIEVLVTVR
jgi:hypothetical protein